MLLPRRLYVRAGNGVMTFLDKSYSHALFGLKTSFWTIMQKVCIIRHIIKENGTKVLLLLKVTVIVRPAAQVFCPQNNLNGTRRGGIKRK